MEYTGELFGVEYLYSQSGHVMDTEYVDTQIDEGFEDIDEEDPVHVPTCDAADDSTLTLPPIDSDSDADEDEEVRDTIKVHEGHRNIVALFHFSFVWTVFIHSFINSLFTPIYSATLGCNNYCRRKELRKLSMPLVSQDGISSTNWQQLS